MIVKNLKYNLNDFIFNNNGLITLSAAVIIGNSTNIIIKSLIYNIIMPLIYPFIKTKELDDWQNHRTKIGPFRLKLMQFISDLIYFILIFILVFVFLQIIISKLILTKN